MGVELRVCASRALYIEALELVMQHIQQRCLTLRLVRGALRAQLLVRLPLPVLPAELDGAQPQLLPHPLPLLQQLARAEGLVPQGVPAAPACWP